MREGKRNRLGMLEKAVLSSASLCPLPPLRMSSGVLEAIVNGFKTLARECCEWSAVFKTHGRRDATRQLVQWRAISKREMQYRDANIYQMASTSHRKPGHGRCLDKNVRPSTNGSSWTYHAPQRIRVITNLQKQPSLAAKIARIVSYSSPSLIAELREWQKVFSSTNAAHVALLTLWPSRLRTI
jgi:hypothetical protein